MSSQEVEVLVVGAGQAGLAMSEHLSNCGVPHLVVERNRIAERWRSERWDSLVANGPAWHDRFPGLEFSDLDPDGFASKEQRIELHLGGLARRQVPGRPHRDPARLPRLPDEPLTGVADYTPRQLEYFVAVAESGNITGAAERTDGGTSGRSPVSV